MGKYSYRWAAVGKDGQGIHISPIYKNRLAALIKTSDAIKTAIDMHGIGNGATLELVKIGDYGAMVSLRIPIKE